MSGQTPSASQQATISAQTVWEQWVEATFSDLESRAYFLPPVYFNRVPMTRQSTAGQKVLVLREAPGKAGQSTLGQAGQSRPGQAGQSRRRQAGQSNQPALTPSARNTSAQPPHVQDSDVRDDAALQRCLFCLQKMSDENREVLAGLSQLQFGQYLGEPCYAAAAAHLPVAKNLPAASPRNTQGDFDVLLIHRQYGIVVCEVKAFGDNVGDLKRSQQDIDKNIRSKLTQAVSQLDKAEAMLSHLVSDVTPSLRITKAIVVPNLTARQVQQAISGYPVLVQDLCRCLGTTDAADITGLCLCSDQLSDPKTPWDVSSDVLRELGNWWQRRVAVSGSDSHMTCDNYKKLVARFCGPATTVTVPCTSPPRLCVKTLCQAVSWTGECYTAQISLFPEQLHLLNTAHRRVFVAGPPGTGKTVVLLLMATEWLRCGNDVHIVSTWSLSRAACCMLYQLLLQIVNTQLTSVVSHGQPHLLLCDFYREDVEEDVEYDFYREDVEYDFYREDVEEDVEYDFYREDTEEDVEYDFYREDVGEDVEYDFYREDVEEDVEYDFYREDVEEDVEYDFYREDVEEDVEYDFYREDTEEDVEYDFYREDVEEDVEYDFYREDVEDDVEYDFYREDVEEDVKYDFYREDVEEDVECDFYREDVEEDVECDFYREDVEEDVEYDFYREDVEEDVECDFYREDVEEDVEYDFYREDVEEDVEYDFYREDVEYDFYREDVEEDVEYDFYREDVEEDVECDFYREDVEYDFYWEDVEEDVEYNFYWEDVEYDFCWEDVEYDFYRVDVEEDVEKAVNDLSLAARRGSLYVIADEVLGPNYFKTFCDKLLTQVPGLHLWAASYYESHAPTGWHVERFTRPLRSPPAVVREVQQAWQITVSRVVLAYSERDVADHTDGPPVRRLYHEGQGHSGDYPDDCVTCCREVVSFLLSLGIPVSSTTSTTATTINSSTTPPCLQWRDVFVLSKRVGVRDHRKVERALTEADIPVRVMKDDDIEDVATARSDVVWVAGGDRVRGLERKVVVCLQDGFDDLRLDAMSRCTSQLVIVSPDPLAT